LLKEGTHEKSPKCLGGNLGDFGEFCKGLKLSFRRPFVGTTGLAGNGDFRTEEGLLGCIYKIEVKKVSDDP